jgi:hypothetical protein
MQIVYSLCMEVMCAVDASMKSMAHVTILYLLRSISLLYFKSAIPKLSPVL